MAPDKSKYIIRKLNGEWVLRLPDQMGGWKFSLPTWDITLVLMDGIEIYRKNFHLTDGWMYVKPIIKEIL